jgi:hypothetical protein
MASGVNRTECTLAIPSRHDLAKQLSWSRAELGKADSTIYTHGPFITGLKPDAYDG